MSRTDLERAKALALGALIFNTVVSFVMGLMLGLALGALL